LKVASLIALAEMEVVVLAPIDAAVMDTTTTHTWYFFKHGQLRDQ
jgi:hypothetical protein